MKQKSSKEIITADEVANYVVCPEAWRLKFIGKGRKQHTERVKHSKQLRQEWVETQDLSSKLRSYAKIAYLLLVGLVIVVFLLEYRRTSDEAKRRMLPNTMGTEKEAVVE